MDVRVDHEGVDVEREEDEVQPRDQPQHVDVVLGGELQLHERVDEEGGDEEGEKQQHLHDDVREVAPPADAEEEDKPHRAAAGEEPDHDLTRSERNELVGEVQVERDRDQRRLEDLHQVVIPDVADDGRLVLPLELVLLLEGLVDVVVVPVVGTAVVVPDHLASMEGELLSLYWHDSEKNAYSLSRRNKGIVK